MLNVGDVRGARLCHSASIGYDKYMWGITKEIRTVQQRLALLKQQERELRILFSQSHATLADTQEIENKLVALATEIADLESVVAKTT